jgi:hypothetical protein
MRVVAMLARPSHSCNLAMSAWCSSALVAAVARRAWAPDLLETRRSALPQARTVFENYPATSALRCVAFSTRLLAHHPVTGNITARWLLNDWSDKGLKTVKALHLDRREALQKGYLLTLRRLSEALRAALQLGAVDAVQLVEKLQSEDDHGLLDWCFSDRGKTLEPFSQLHAQHPDVWSACVKALNPGL